MKLDCALSNLTRRSLRAVMVEHLSDLARQGVRRERFLKKVHTLL